ncbi:UNVERIFIED_CONTAM: hypothetical protein GTU68_030479, partial [Idotea baltica]|nr:hypothetical protein [Idotea baltica]
MFARLSNMFGGNEFEAAASSSQNSSPMSNFGGSSLPKRPGDQHYEHINNSVSVLEKMANLYAEKLMSDIVICVGHWELPAHRLILCASSEVFQIMLMNPEWNESREKRICLQEAPECVEVFEKFLRYLYTGHLTLSHDSVLPILALADKYLVKDLIKMCEEYMKEHLVSAARNGYLFSWLQYTV